MANWLQRAIYNLGNAVPLALIMAMVWYFEFKTWHVPAVLTGAACAVTVLFIVFFRFAARNCTIKSIAASKITSMDSWMIGYFFVYLLPVVTVKWNQYHLDIVIVAAILLIFLFLSAVMALPNILLFLAGYHFYKVEVAGTGIDDYVFISKRRRIRNITEVTVVAHVFEKLLFDEGGQRHRV